MIQCLGAPVSIFTNFSDLYFPLNFRGQIASEADSKPPVTRFVRLSTRREAFQKV